MVSHETWQLVNGFECLLPYIILDIIDFFQFISLTNSFTQISFTLKSIFYKMTAMLYFLLFSFVSKNLTNYGRRHLNLFTNCHVSWDTLYQTIWMNQLELCTTTDLWLILETKLSRLSTFLIFNSVVHGDNH